MRAEQKAENTTSTNPAMAVERSAASDPAVTVPSFHDPTDYGSSTPEGKRRNPSFSDEDYGAKSSTPVGTATPVHDYVDDSTVTPKGTTLNPISSSSDDFGVKNSDLDVTSENGNSSADCSVPAAKRLRLDPTSPDTEGEYSLLQYQDGSLNSALDNVASSGGDTVIMVCNVTVEKADFVKLKMNWVDGQNRELMHQLLQFLKNRFVWAFVDSLPSRATRTAITLGYSLYRDKTTSLVLNFLYCFMLNGQSYIVYPINAGSSSGMREKSFRHAFLFVGTNCEHVSIVTW